MAATKNLFNIIFENDEFVAIDKPSGLLTIPDRHDENIHSLYTLLQNKYGKIFIVHRLDKDTSGLILFAKNEKTHKFLSQLFEQRNIQKYYLGIIKGSLTNTKGVIDEPLIEHPTNRGMMTVSKKGKPSSTGYEVLEDHKLYSLVKFHLQTGRTHQIRVHMKFIGHPLACDELYGDGQPVKLSSFKKKFRLSKDEEEENPLLKRLALHSSSLNFVDEHGKEINLEAPLPKDFRALLNQLKKK